jgi:hypothetical protein
MVLSAKGRNASIAFVMQTKSRLHDELAKPVPQLAECMGEPS